MSTSVVGTTLDAIRAALVLRSDLTGVNVFSGPVSEEEGGTECIWFGDAELIEEPAAMGGNVTDDWTVDGQAWAIMKPWQDSTELTIKAARDRALAIFAEVEEHIGDTYGESASLPTVGITEGTLRQGITPEGRRCAVDFKIVISNLKNP
jgi:hypothetical protein